MPADQHQLAVLVEHLQGLGHKAALRMLGVFALFLQRHLHMDSVADKHRVDEPQAVVAVGEGGGVDQVRGHSNRYGKGQGTVGDAPAELRGLGEFRVHVVGEEIPGLACVEHDIRLRDGAPDVLAHASNLIFFKVNCLFHRLISFMIESVSLLVFS